MNATSPGSAFKAITLGLFVDFGGTLLATVMLGLAYAFYFGLTGSAPGELAAATSDPHSSFSYAAAALGGLFSILGGYVCARIARRSEYLIGAVLALLAMAAALMLAYEPGSWGLNLALAALTGATIMLGAHLGVRRNRR